MIRENHVEGRKAILRHRIEKDVQLLEVLFHFSPQKLIVHLRIGGTLA